MLIIETGAALSRALDPPLLPDVKRLLALRRGQLGGHIEDGARFIVVEAGDTIADIEQALAFPITDDGEPCFEHVTNHRGIFELVFILSDDGAADVVLVPDNDGIAPALIQLCRLHATEPTTL